MRALWILGLLGLLIGCTNTVNVTGPDCHAAATASGGGGGAGTSGEAGGAYRDRALVARQKCARLEPVASDALKTKCAALAASESVWAERDRAVLAALLASRTITPETFDAAVSAGERLLKLALEIAPLAAGL